MGSILEVAVALAIFALCSEAILKAQYQTRSSEAAAWRSEQSILEDLSLGVSELAHPPCSVEATATELRVFSCVKGEGRPVTHSVILE